MKFERKQSGILRKYLANKMFSLFASGMIDPEVLRCYYLKKRPWSSRPSFFRTQENPLTKFAGQRGRYAERIGCQVQPIEDLDLRSYGLVLLAKFLEESSGIVESCHVTFGSNNGNLSRWFLERGWWLFEAIVYNGCTMTEILELWLRLKYVGDLRNLRTGNSFFLFYRRHSRSNFGLSENYSTNY